MERERLKSRLGFILISAGCAIGIGNVWKFPYMAGQNGGAIFVLIYLFFLIVMGVPAMTIEFALGRAGQKSPVMLYQQLEKKGQKWHIHGYAAMAGNVLLMMFYSVVSAWMLQYFVMMATGHFSGLNPTEIGGAFDGMLANPVSLFIYTAIIVVAGFGICSFGVQKGVERVTKVMMIALLAIMVILAVNSAFLDGGSKGLEFYLKPNLDNLLNIGVGNVIVAAMNQAFFTLSSGIGSMAIFGSYIGKERALLGESVNVALLDTFVALCSGFIIFPACFAYGVDVGQGPKLIFVTLPNIFNNMPLGRLWGSLFFVFMSFAAVSTVIAVYENIISCCIDLFKWSRKKACIVCTIGMLILVLPCILGFNVLSDIQPRGEGSTIMDLEDFLVSNVILPLGALTYVLFSVSRCGWGWKNFMNEANTGKGLKVANWMRIYMTYILPVIIIAVFLIGIL